MRRSTNVTQEDVPLIKGGNKAGTTRTFECALYVVFQTFAARERQPAGLLEQQAFT